MHKQFDELLARLREVSDLQNAGALLNWDQATYMPPAGAAARGRQMSTLTRLAHEKYTDPAIGKLLDGLKGFERDHAFDSFEASVVRFNRREYERQTKVPASFVAEMEEHAAGSYDRWTRARPKNDFAAVRSDLEKTLDYSRRLANFYPGYDHIADPLIDFSDEGMKAESVRAIFNELRDKLVPIVKDVTDRGPAEDACLRHEYPEADQKAFGEDIARAFGFDFERGRQDKTHHPFMTKFALGDVRITTRFNERFLSTGLFGTLHETGHALYELGINRKFEDTGLDSGTSSGVHESQSRLWENLVGRGREFWEGWYPKAQAAFPNQLGGVGVDEFYAAVNRVEPGLIRVEADELTYNLHIIIRFNLECELLEGSLEIKDLPDTWRDRYASDLGVTPSDDTDGVLQDVHWFGGRIGGSFQGYALGNLLNAQFFESAVAAHPTIPDDIRSGNFEVLHGWLRENIYQYGSMFTAPELVQRVTGGGVEVDPFIRYVRRKFSVT
jgi:carboxypeptidase Taq